MREKILEVIEKNARIDLKDLAAMLGVEETELANEIAAMEKEKVICGYHTLINWDNTSEEKVTALIEVQVTPQRGLGFDKIAERMYNYPEVRAVYLMSGGFDFTVIIEEKTMKEVATFVTERLAPLEAIRGTGTHFILKKYKDHGTVLVENNKDERMLVTP
ncbi:MAG: Lrp/AsnC family transcriptional regulator [Lachnospiraceae bacterium]|nr:Lrp/AsnC family transcriptional regulator [Lachnospiraceae bacterium]